MTAVADEVPHFPAAADTAEAVRAWLAFLTNERAYAANTLDAYERDIRQFFCFLNGHFGHPAGFGDLNRLTPQDCRAFMASRRGEGTASRSLSRAISALRMFFLFLERAKLLKNRAVLAVALPKIPFSVPKPLTIPKAMHVMQEGAASQSRGQEKWIGARDGAALLLLYGSGLRVSEALDLPRREAPLPPLPLTRTMSRGGRGASRRGRSSASETRRPEP